MEPPRRRQNRSCDQCRASKRRCVQIDESAVGHLRCRTCARLGRRCTFNFVHHHSTPKQKQPFVISDTDPLATQLTAAPLLDNMTSQSAPYLMHSMEFEGLDGFDATLASSVMTPPFYDVPAIAFTDCLTIPNDSLDGPPEVTSIGSDINSVIACDTSVSQDPIDTYSNLPPTTFDACVDSTLPPVQVVRPRAAHNSPLSLLNSTMNLRLDNEYLTLIFHSLTIALYVRYLSPPSNVLTNESPYEINFEQSGHNLLHTRRDAGTESIQGVSGLQSIPSASQCEIDSSTCIKPSRLQNDVAKVGAIDLRVHKVTMIGVALFLDHFGPIYGSYRSKMDKQEDEALLVATVRAFVLANAPIARGTTDQSDDTSAIFDNAWLDAYHRLSRSMTRRSFMLAYTSFTFDLLPVPLSLSSDPQFSEGKERLLRHSVQQLQGLLSTVASFCGRMSSHSKYRSVLEACRRTMEWHAYVRDTISAFTNCSACIMDDTLLGSDGYIAQFSGTMTVDPFEIQEETLHRKCQKLSCRLFSFYRDIIRIRSCVNEAQKDSATTRRPLHEAVSHVTAALDFFWESWVHTSLEQFAQLLPASQLSFGFIVVYWGLGVLKVYEVLQSTTNLAVTGFSDLWMIARRSRSKAIILHAKIMKAIMDNSNDGGLPVLEGTNFKLPFMAHHANTTLLTLALTTAIEHTVDMILAGELDANGDWLQPSLWCLLSLEHSASGRSSVRPAIDKLIQRYGDIIMECWSGEEELMGYDG